MSATEAPTGAAPAATPASDRTFRLTRDWAFWVQLLGLVGLWAFSLSTVAWFAWRASELRRLHDSWHAAVFLGAPVGAIFITFSIIMTYLFVKLGLHAKEVPPPPTAIDEVEEHLTQGVLSKWSKKFWAALVILAAITAVSMYEWWKQLNGGLGVTGLARTVPWGLYITNFVFFIGMSYGGTLVSAVLRIARAEWRRPITRAAEAVACLVLLIGAWNILLDIGRPDRVAKVFIWGRLQSPLMWDVVAVTVYLITCVLYLYLPLIPDLALMRHRVKGWRKPIYHLFSFGWTDAPAQRHALEKCISIVAVMVIPIAVCVHSVVAWVFSLTIQPLWHSTIFAPYFVLGAMFSGIAGLVIVLAVTRRGMKLENFLRPVHFANLGILLLVLSLIWLYFTGTEYLTVYYGDEPAEMAILMAKLKGVFAPLTWTMLACNFVIPVAILARKKTRTITGVVIASIAIVIGMWLERFTIVVPTLEAPRLPGHHFFYLPSFTELSLMAGGFAAFALMYLVFTRLFPVVSLWEMKEGREDAAKETAERIRSYFPSDDKEKAS